MKRSLFKQLTVSAFFACCLSADVPDMREQAEGAADDSNGSKRRTSNIATSPRRGASGHLAADVEHRTSNESGKFGHFDVATSPLRERSGKWPLSPSAWRGADVELRDGNTRTFCFPLSAFSSQQALALSAIWPLGGFGIHPMDRGVRWDMLSSVSPEAMNVPTDPRDMVFCVPRYRMPLALQESARPAFADLPAPAEAGFAKAGALRAGRPCPVGFWQPAMLLDVAGRSGRVDMMAMIPRLKKVFMNEGVPQQWVWMAEVESALNPRAKSSAGAVGLFQLMPGTARRFGLRTAPVDDRMMPEKSASAAAQYLKFLRQEFGCWSLALAAYNAGEGRVMEIMQKRKARTFEEVKRYLPSETRAYVPKVMAIVALREDQLHGVPGAYWMP